MMTLPVRWCFVVLVERALVGFNLYRLLAALLQGVGWGGGENAVKHMPYIFFVS